MKLKLHAVALAALAVLAFAKAPVQAQEMKASGTYGSDEAAAKKGRGLFNARGCQGCHTVGKGRLAGPDLLGVTERRESEWLKKWLKNPDELLATDPVAQEMLKEYNNAKMPNMKLKDEEIEALMHYMAAESQKVKK